MIYLILLIALGLRLVLLNQSFWLDEAASLSMSILPLDQLLTALQNDFHPPLYYLLLHYWLQLGITSEWFLRLPSVLFGVATVYVVYLLFLPAKAKWLPLIAALFLAFNPLHIYYSQELRMYSLNTFLTAASWYFLSRSFTRQHQYSPWLFSLLTFLNLYTFYLAFFNLLAQAAYVFFLHRKSFKKIIIFSLLPILLFLPWLPTFMRQLEGGSNLRQLLPGWSALSGNFDLKSLLLIPLKFSLGRVNLSTSKLYLLTAASAAVYFSSLLAIGLKHKSAKLPLFWLGIPLSLALITSIFTPILGYWRYIFLLPAFTSLIAIGVHLLPAKLRFLNVSVVLVTLLMANLLFFLSPSSWREDWRAAAAFAASFDQNETVSVFAFSDAFAPIKWYASNLNYAAPFKDFNNDPQLLDLTLSQATLTASRILYFNYLSPLTDPSGNLLAWFNNAGYTLEATKNFNGVGFVYVYSAPVKP